MKGSRRVFSGGWVGGGGGEGGGRGVVCCYWRVKKVFFAVGLVGGWVVVVVGEWVLMSGL